MIVFLLIWVWPKESLEGVDPKDIDKLPTDPYFAKTLGFLFLTILTFCCSCCFLLTSKCKFLQATRMGSDEGMMDDGDDEMDL